MRSLTLNRLCLLSCLFIFISSISGCSSAVFNPDKRVLKFPTPKIITSEIAEKIPDSVFVAHIKRHRVHTLNNINGYFPVKLSVVATVEKVIGRLMLVPNTCMGDCEVWRLAVFKLVKPIHGKPPLGKKLISNEAGSNNFTSFKIEPDEFVAIFPANDDGEFVDIKIDSEPHIYQFIFFAGGIGFKTGIYSPLGQPETINPYILTSPLDKLPISMLDRYENVILPAAKKK